MFSQPIIATLERLTRLERGLAAKQRAVEEARAAVDAAAVGVPKILARQRYREAEEAATAQQAEAASLKEEARAYQGESLYDFYELVAAYRVTESAAKKRIAALEAELAEEEARQSTQAWKWHGRKERPQAREITAIRERIAAVRREQDEAKENIAEVLEIVEADDRSRSEAEEVVAWAARGYTGERPAAIVRGEEEFRREMAEGATRLPLVPARVIAARWAAAAPVRSDDDDWVGVGEWNPQPLTAGIFDVLAPRRRVVEEEIAQSTGRIPAALTRMLEAKKAAKAKAVAC